MRDRKHIPSVHGGCELTQEKISPEEVVGGGPSVILRRTPEPGYSIWSPPWQAAKTPAAMFLAEFSSLFFSRRGGREKSAQNGALFGT